MARRVKVKQGENLTDANLEKVIGLLEADKPITKKAACEILNITYNTTRLNNIIQQHKDDKEFRATMRKQMRGTPVDIDAASQIVSSYLSGESLLNISNSTFRSTNVIKNILEKYNVPIRNTAVDYFHPVFIDNDEAIKEDYKKGDLVYSARYDSPATIDSILPSEKHGMVYGIWLHGLNRMHAFQPYYELADLRRVQKELSIEMQDLDAQEVRHLIAEGLINQKKQMDKRK